MAAPNVVGVTSIFGKTALANTTSTSTAPSLVYNNFIFNGGGTGDCTGFAIYLCTYLNFHNNNVLINSSLSASAGYYHYPQYTNSYIRLVNNNFGVIGILSKHSIVL
jgi:hypothetical protein